MPADPHELRTAHRRHTLHAIIPLLPKAYQAFSQKYVLGNHHTCACLCILSQVQVTQGEAVHTGIHANNMAWKSVCNIVKEENAGRRHVVHVGPWLFLNEYWQQSVYGWCLVHASFFHQRGMISTNDTIIEMQEINSPINTVEVFFRQLMVSSFAPCPSSSLFALLFSLIFVNSALLLLLLLLLLFSLLSWNTFAGDQHQQRGGVHCHHCGWQREKPFSPDHCPCQISFAHVFLQRHQRRNTWYWMLFFGVKMWWPKLLPVCCLSPPLGSPNCKLLRAENLASTFPGPSTRIQEGGNLVSRGRGFGKECCSHYLPRSSTTKSM